MFNSVSKRLASLLVLGLFLVSTLPARAEDVEEEEDLPVETTRPKKETDKKKKRKYYIPDTNRVDAGIFHVGFGAGGNFYVEPKVDVATRTPNGDYFQEFGFQGGIFFDYDYSALTENVPLALRGMIGYKYILDSVHMIAFDTSARYMFRVSDKASFGVGIGGSAAVWIRKAVTATATTPAAEAETLFLPSFLVEAGFDFQPFFVDVKTLINRIGQETNIYGFELYFGVRL